MENRQEPMETCSTERIFRQQLRQVCLLLLVLCDLQFDTLSTFSTVFRIHQLGARYSHTSNAICKSEARPGILLLANHFVSSYRASERDHVLFRDAATNMGT